MNTEVALCHLICIKTAKLPNERKSTSANMLMQQLPIHWRGNVPQKPRVLSEI